MSNNLIYYIPPGPDQPFKICIPDALLNYAIRLYHLALNHVGTTRLRDQSRRTFTIQGYKLMLPISYVHVTHVKVTNCPVKDVVSYHQEKNSAPWQAVTVDLIGPWTIKLDG